MLDFYGTFRGKCKECSCIEYVTENNSIKCAYCDHSPSKHEIKPESSSNETCDEEAVFKMFPSLLFLFQLTLIYPVLHSVKLSVTKLKTVLKNQLLRSEMFCMELTYNFFHFNGQPKFDVSEHYKIVGESKICTNIFKEDHDLNNSVFTLSDVVINNKSYRAGDFILKQEEKITIFSQVMPYLNGDDLGGTERKTIFNLLVNEIIYYLDNENLLMLSNRNVQGIGYSQLQNKLLETYPKMLKESHNLLRKHRSKGPLSVLTTTISDRRRKKRERLRRSNYNFDLSKEEILEILKLVQEVELIMKKNISDMCEGLKTLCRKLKKEVSMNHLMDLVQYLGPDSDCLFIK
ncbi:hypothetical protein Avbf_16025 [Armadillidium vulgare]|nr:hypothetical protein Avbf_16025 [Armadillidium vulgare]